MVQYCIGTSGWHHDDWRGRFYPEKLARAKRLASLVVYLRAVYICFNNDIEASAVRNAMTLRDYLKKQDSV